MHIQANLPFFTDLECQNVFIIWKWNVTAKHFVSLCCGHLQQNHYSSSPKYPGWTFLHHSTLPLPPPFCFSPHHQFKNHREHSLHLQCLPCILSNSYTWVDSPQFPHMWDILLITTVLHIEKELLPFSWWCKLKWCQLPGGTRDQLPQRKWMLWRV